MFQIRLLGHVRVPLVSLRALSTGNHHLLPNHILALIHDTEHYPVQWPRPFALGALARTWDSLGPSLADLEDHLLALTPQGNDSDITSRTLLNGWVLAPNVDAIERIERAVIKVNDQQISGPRQRIVYVFLMLQYCLLLDKVFEVPNNQPLIERIHQWCDDHQTFDYRNFRYYLWRYLQASDDPQHNIEAQKYVTKSIKGEFAKDCLFYTWSRSLPIVPLEHCSKLFDFEPFDLFCDKMVAKSACDEHFSLMLQSLSHWSEGRYSESLSNLATVTEAVSGSITSTRVRVELIRSLIVAMTKIANDSQEHDMSLVHEFLDLAGEKIYKTTGCPLLISLIWTFTPWREESQNLKTTYMEIKSMSPILRQIRTVTNHPDFMYSQRSLDALADLSYKLDSFNPMSQGANRGKNIVLDDKLIDQLIPNNIAHQIQNQTIPLTPELLKELSDIKVLESLALNNILQAVNLTVNEYHQHRGVSIEVLEKVLERVHPDANEDLFRQVKEATPLKSKAAEFVFAKEVEFNLKSNFSMWKQGKYFEAFDLNLKLYRMLLEEEYHLEKEPLQRFQKEIRNLIHYFIEKAAEMRLGENILDFVENECVIIGQTYNDYSLALALWEVMFFGNYFQYQRRAEELFLEHQAIQKQLNIKRILKRASQFEDEEIFRRILELCLTHDLEIDKKTLAFEGLLKHQCTRGYMKRTMATLKTAMDLGIPIGDDVKKVINKTNNELQASEARGVIAAFKDLWKGGTSSK